MHLNFSAEHLVLKEKKPILQLPDSQRRWQRWKFRTFSVAMGELVSSEHMDEIEEMMVAKTILVGRFSEKHQCYQRPAMDISYVAPCVQQFGPNLDEKTIISFLGDFIF